MSQISNNIPVTPQLGNASTGHAQSAGSSTSTAQGVDAAGTQSASPTLAQGAKSSHQPAPGAIDNAVVQINDYMQHANRSLEFSVDKSTGQTIIKVIDQTTGKTLQQIPPEYAIKLAQTLLDTHKVSSIGIQFTT